MQKFRFILLINILIYFGFINLDAQNRVYYELYENNELTKIEKLIESNQIKDVNWNNFFKTLFQENSETAISSFISIYEKTSDNLLKKIILHRLSQYYYAKGLYETADKVLRNKDFREQLFSLKKKEILFGVQLGAFSTYENALKSKNQFSRTVDDIYIIAKDKNGRRLYVVVAGKYSSQNEAQQLNRLISSRHGQKGIVIQY